MLFTCIGTIVAQNNARTISGQAKDQDGNPIPGVSVFIKGTAIGVNGDIDGKYVLRIPSVTSLPDNPVVVFSFIGMKQEEIALKDQTVINVVLHDDSSLDEVVVTGYQTVSKRDMAGSYQQIKAEEILMPSYTSIDQMLQGKVAGMVVTQTSSRVGTSPDIKIRGTSTILGNTAPLWVVDGVIQPDPLTIDPSALMTDDLSNIIGNQISWLNPSDIETINVLRDASATAIYGSKASNGVIVITTKQGKTGKTTVKYSGSVTVRAKSNYGQFNLMNSQERIQFSREAFESGSSYSGSFAPIKQKDTYEGLYRMYLDKDITYEEYRDGYRRLETVNTDWFDILTRTAVSHNHNLSLAGGTEKIVYNASVSYGDNRGTEMKNDASKMSARLRIGANLRHNIHLDASIIGSLDETYGYGPGVSPMAYATTTSRAIPAYEDDGSRLFYRYPSNYTYWVLGLDLGYNILNEIENTYARSKSTRLNATLDFRWDIIKGLTYQFTGGYSINNNRNESYAGEKSYYVANNFRGYDYGTKMDGDPEYAAAVIPFGGELQTYDKMESNYNFQNKILYHKTFRDSHRINAMIGLEIRSTRYDAQRNTLWGYMPDRGKKLAQAVDPDKFQSMNSSTLPVHGIFSQLYRGAWSYQGMENNYLSYFATVSYSFRNRYVLNASIRNDESKRFGQDVNKRFDPMYSFALSWDAAEEPFLKNANWLDQLRIRASYGIQGNALQSVSPDLILAYQGVVGHYNQYGNSIRSLPNPELSWESTKSWNIGFDLQLLKWITLTAEYYTRASDAIVYQEVAKEYGFSTLALNGGRVKNKGFEFTLNITPVQTKDWSWTVGLNSSRNWNTANDVDSGLKQVYDFIHGASGRILKQGYPLSGFWSYSFKGLNDETGYPEFNLDCGETDDPTDFLVYSGQREASFTGGLTTRLRWKQFTYSADFSALLGAKKRLPNPFSSLERLPSPYSNMDRELLDRWTKPGDNTTIPAFYHGGTSSYIYLPNGDSGSMYDMWGNSDLRVVDASFLRCTQMSLSWNAGKGVCSALHISDLMMSLTVNNIFVICDSRFNGFDPELGNSVMPKIVSFGINVGF